jgi:hypothetical protein
MQLADELFSSFTVPDDAAVPPPTCGLVAPASESISAYWAVPDSLRLCLLLYRLANRMLTHFESSSMVYSMSLTASALTRFIDYPPAFEVYQLVRNST